MLSSGGVLVVTQDPAVARLVIEVVDASTTATGCRESQTLEELSEELDRAPAAAVVIDIDAAPAEILGNLHAIVDRFQGTRFIVLASEQRDDWVHQAMQGGARDFLVKAAVATTLPTVLDRLIPLAATNGWVARSLVTVLSASGGCGATTLAVNLAQELQQFNASTLLIDLDTCYGSLARYLGVNAEYGVADVLADGDRIDAHLVKSTAVTYREQLHVLASPATTHGGWPTALKLEHLNRMLRVVKQTYVHTVIDAPRVPIDVAVTLARSSVITLLVLELNVDDIRIAQGQLSSLIEAGVPPQRVLPIVNRFRRRRSMISLGEAKKALGVERIGRLGNDFKRVLASINLGKTLVETAPRSAVRRDIQQLANAIHNARAGEIVWGRP